ncbi:hypothetical protein BDV26DRAFT_252414 [Aspergillus bertholletiae]|uniref:Uncharacterized protein n=1 Tax=Aspergillus bertholletiae TaxID=1226010 RepID=A0A5N7BMI0_9EURO|nr:hypothetical protein BDV26DRAFT_252414 [Aspergillus bertholletiae]
MLLRYSTAILLSDSMECIFFRYLRGDYAEPVKCTCTATDKVKTDTSRDQLKSLEDPLVAHMKAYIFSEIYIVPDLKELVLTKTKVPIEVMKKPHTVDNRLGAISL